jgi:3-hydroxyacyl-CoA dehydrogenase/enoyl-CoA hydratase/3-hydroxybutyryl-CoA epimerase
VRSPEADQLPGTSTQQIRSELAGDGVLIATIDMPGRSMNVFSVALMDALEELMDRVDGDPGIQAVVLTSAKASFLAGADLAMVKGFTDSARTLDEPAMIALCGRLGRLLVRLEASAKPYVAAVNGLALGGGLELAMACRACIVVDDARTQLGLPEVRWGLLPGAGGTQRLPRLAGFDAGLSLLLTGRSMAPQEAVRLGVFASAVPEHELLQTALGLAASLRGSPWSPADKFPFLAQHDVPARTPEVVMELAHRHGVSADYLASYPAYETIIDCVLLGARQPLPEASATEMRQFLRLMFDPVAGNMIRALFLNRQRADRQLAAPRELKVEELRHGQWSAAGALWQESLGRSRIPLVLDDALAADTIALRDSRGLLHTVRVGTLETVDGTACDGCARALLSPAGPRGRVLEIIGGSPETAQALAALAPRLGAALPYRSGDAESVLVRLRPTAAISLDEQAERALLLLDSGAAPDAATLDVATCAAELTPAYTGGPLSHLWQNQTRLLEVMSAPARAAWDRQNAALAEAFA